MKIELVDQSRVKEFCDNCGFELEKNFFGNYAKYTHRDGKNYCKQCHDRIKTAKLMKNV